MVLHIAGKWVASKMQIKWEAKQRTYFTYLPGNCVKALRGHIVLHRKGLNVQSILNSSVLRVGFRETMLSCSPTSKEKASLTPSASSISCHGLCLHEHSFQCCPNPVGSLGFLKTKEFVFFIHSFPCSTCNYFFLTHNVKSQPLFR